MNKSTKVQFAATNMESVAFILSLVKKFRKINDNLELLTIGIFSLVCINEEITNSDVCDYFNISKDKANIHLRILSTNGLGVVKEKFEQKVAIKVKTLSLTKKGQSVKKELLTLLG